MAETSPWVVSGDPREIRKAFNSLPVDKQLGIVLGVRGKERLRYLFFSENSEELVHRLPELEIFLTVKVDRIPPFFLRITIPSNGWILSFSPSTIFTWTLTVSPTLSSGRSNLNCSLSTNSIGFISNSSQ